MDSKNLLLCGNEESYLRIEGATLFIRTSLNFFFNFCFASADELVEKESNYNLQSEQFHKYLEKYSSEISNMYNQIELLNNNLNSLSSEVIIK